MPKLIVTHFNPDLDAICSCWLLQRFDPDFKQTQIEFVAAGETYQHQKVDIKKDVIHVDTGMGKFDHHQREESTCAAKLVFDHLKSKYQHLQDDRALVQLIEVVRQLDHFEEVLWPEPDADRYNFLLDQILDGLKNSGRANDYDLIDLGFMGLDGVYSSLKIKNKAREELKEGIEFDTRWGRAIGCLTQTNEVLKLGQKLGFILVVQKDAKTEHIRIKARPGSGIDLTEAKEKLAKLDPKATWFLHISKRMLLNGSTKNPKMKPSSLSLKKVIEVLTNV